RAPRDPHDGHAVGGDLEFEPVADRVVAMPRTSRDIEPADEERRIVVRPKTDLVSVAVSSRYRQPEPAPSGPPRSDLVEPRDEDRGAAAARFGERRVERGAELPDALGVELKGEEIAARVCPIEDPEPGGRAFGLLEPEALDEDLVVGSRDGDVHEPARGRRPRRTDTELRGDRVVAVEALRHRG